MLNKILKKYWGYDSFRPMQKEIIDSVLSGKDTLGILPTGGGKSITFQVPGLMSEGLTIVVTPLISLMKDQVDNLKKRGIQAAYLHSGMNFREKNLQRERIFNNKAKFLYVSPERLAGDIFINDIRHLKVNLIVVDEAHCISQWGYDFRPSYLKIKKLRKAFPGSQVLALTASATRVVAKDICDQLEFKKDFNILRGSVARDNLSYVVRKSEGKLYDILHILNSVPGCGIVYVRSRKLTREIAEYLCNSGISATFYHAGLDNLEKEKRQQKWKDDEIRVMVATNAFGMGIDKPNVRIVIHYDFPPSLEEYYQEAGRSGRDGKQAYAVLLYGPSDKATLRRRLTLEFPPKETIKRIYTRLCVFSHLEIGEGYDRIVDFDLIRFCRTFNLEERTVRPSLRILGQAGYVEFIEEIENSSRIMITIDREELYRTRLSSPTHEKILTTILRTYPGLFTDYVFISEKKISFLTGLDQSEIYEKLVELSKEKIISYIPRKKNPMLYFPTSMEEEKYIQIGKSIYEERLETFKQRIEAMISYAYDETGCRVRRLMEYFGEEEGDDCKTCDNCRKMKVVKKGGNEKDILRHLERLLETLSEGITDNELREIYGKHYPTVSRHLRELAEDEIMKYKNGKWIKP